MALQPASGSSSQFTQQGSIDWVQLATTTVSFPFPILARLAAADVAPLTIMVAQQLSSNFHLSKDGHSRLTDALQNLSSFSSLGSAIWFGFGIKHIVRDLAETTEGLVAIALCGCLSELHPPKACASILMELADVSGAPSELRPSAQQWMNLVATCSGVLRPTNFASVAGQFMSHHGSEWKYNTMEQYEDVAKALSAVGRLSSGSLDSITLAGGRSCGWIAAFGHRFLGIDVEIQNAEGDVVYRSTEREERIRIRVVYGESQSDEVQICHSTYFIKTINHLFTTRESRFDTVMSGTVPWKECLRSVFGASIDRLLRDDVNLGRLVGLSARVFEGLSNAEPSNIFKFSQKTWYGYQPGQRGQGFVLSVTTWFPELAALQEQADTQAAASVAFDEAAWEYNRQLRHIGTLCHADGTADPAHCLAALAETIIFLSWNLSGLEIPFQLNPYRFGLLFIYKFISQAGFDGMFRSEHRHRWLEYKAAGSIEHLVSILSMASVYHTAQFLFTTDLYQQTTTAFSATSRGGLCFYLGILRGAADTPEIGRPGIDRPEMATLLHVVPGRIETREGGAHSHVLDKTAGGTLGMFDFAETKYSFADGKCSTTFSSELPKTLATFNGDLATNTGSTELTASLVVQESPGGLLVDICFSGARGQCRVGPYMLFREIAYSSGLVYCRHQLCPQLEPPSDGIFVVDREGTFPISHPWDAINVCRLAGNSLARCVGLVVNRGDREEHMILRGRECIPCCIAAAVSSGRRPVLVIL